MAISLGHYVVRSHSDCSVLLFPSRKALEAVKSKSKGIPYTPYRHIGGMEVQHHSVSTSALDGGKVVVTLRPLYPTTNDPRVYWSEGLHKPYLILVMKVRTPCVIELLLLKPISLNASSGSVDLLVKTVFWARSQNQRKATISSVMFVRPHGTTWLPLDWFSWALILEYFWLICPEIPASLQCNKKNEYLTRRPLYMFYHISLSSS